MRYPDKITEKNTLDKFFNFCFKKNSTLTMMSEPRSYSIHIERKLDRKNMSMMAEMFYENECIHQWSRYISSTIEKHLSEIKRYNTEFNGNWRDYAITNRLETIEEWGGEPDDYLDDTDIIIPAQNDDKLASYSIVSDLQESDLKPVNVDIFRTFINGLRKNEDLNLFGPKGPLSEINRYIKKADGTMEVMSYGDKITSQIINENQCNKLADIFDSLLLKMNTVFGKLEMIKDKKHNKQFFINLEQDLTKILELDV